MNNEMRQQIDKIIKLNEVFDQKNFLGYHSSKRNLTDGYYKGETLNVNIYDDLIRNIYIDIISDYDENLENNDVEAMNKVFHEAGLGFTFVSRQPIEASSFQREKYKYGDYLYEVYGNGDEILVDDPNEINAEIVISKTPLYFKKISED